ncbi:trypsin-like peptidase domain-containing protein [Sphaerimonospora cavernae]|uniref:Trypsin-like peptidase domain-containing protein n=1 Tax=Sphaerimonospora cavernae TaxID=1740611 RepID=A0ABV6UCF8_9ACTN
MSETARTWSGSADEAMAAAIVQVRGQHGALGGAGFLVAPDLVLTCAHVVSDALETPRQEPVAEGTPVMVEFPLCEPPAGADGRPMWPALVENWVPIRAERTGDIAVLRLSEPVPGTRPLPVADPDSVQGGEVRAVGFPHDAPGGIWFEGRVSGATGEGWMQLSRANGQAAHVKPGFSGSPVWHNALSAAVGLLVAAQPAGDAQQAYALRTRTIVREIPGLGPVIRPPSPFRGLKPYEEGDADLFFGREEDIGNVVTALYGARTVTVYGPSGCGKSSLALAGVVPRMRADGYEVLAFNAGEISSVRSALATELYEAIRAGRYGPARADGADQVEDWLAGKGLADTLHRVRGTVSGDLLLVLDQAEALLNHTQTEIDELADLLFPRRRPIGGVRILVTLRSDLMDAVLKHPRLGPALLGGTTSPLAPMSSEQLEEVITKPVELLAVAYEPGLARRILRDAGGEPGILPLLGFVLQQLWEQQDGGYLRNAAYEKMRGVSGALRLHAEEVWKNRVHGKPEKEEAARRLLTKLVRMLPGSQITLRRRVTRDEVDETQWELTEAFAERRLLVLYGGAGEPESAELAHEALITAWPALRHQVEADGKFLAGQAELVHDLRRWRHGEQSASLLPDGEELQAIDRWLGGREGELAEEQREFLALARRRSRMLRRRARAVRTALAMVSALIVALATFLVNQMLVSAERADENKSRVLASSAAEMAEEDPGLAALAAIAAYKIAPTQEARNALLQRFDQFKDAVWMLTGFQGPLLDAAMSADGTVMLASSTGGRATLFVRQAGGRVLRKHLGIDGNAVLPLIGRDGRRIAYAVDGTDSMVWHDVRYTAHDIVVGPAHLLRGAPQKHTVGELGGRYSMVAFSPNADRIAMVTFDGRLRVWDLATQRLQELPGRFPGLRQVWFGSDENTLVAARQSGGSSLVSLDLRSGAVRELEDRRSVSAQDYSAEAEVSADGRVLAVCRKPPHAEKAVYRVIRVSDGRELTRYTSLKDYRPCQRPIVDQTGELVAIDEGIGRWVLLGTRPGTPPRQFIGPVLSYSGVAGPLLGTPSAPIVVYRDRASVTGWQMFPDSGLGVYSPPVLLGRGRTMLARIGKDDDEAADRLAVMETEGRKRTLAEVRIAATPPDPDLLLTVNRAETLVADVADHNKITVYELPRLRKVAEFTTRMPPLDKNGQRERVRSFFLTDEELVTVSGGVIERWNARDGRRLADPLDIHDLFSDGADPTEFYVQRHYQPGYVQLMDVDDHTLRAIHLTTLTDNPNLRIHLGADALNVVVEHSGRYAMVLTRGGVIELWSVADRRRTRRILGSLGPLESTTWKAGILEDDGSGNPGFFLANGHSVRFMRVADGDVDVTSYEFSGKQKFWASTDDGKVLLRSYAPGEHINGDHATGGRAAGERADLFRLDPGLWKSHLCGVLGRDLSEDERRGLPRGLPDVICPL